MQSGLIINIDIYMHFFMTRHSTINGILDDGLHIAGYVLQGRNIKQEAQSRLKSTGQNLFQKAMDTVGPQDNEL